MKLKDLIGIIPTGQVIKVPGKYKGPFFDIDFELLIKEVDRIEATDGIYEEVLTIELAD